MISQTRTSSFAADCYRPRMAEIAASVFETMLELRVRPSGHDDAGWLAGLTAAVYYAGKWNGALLVECSTEQAVNWTARLLALDPPISLDDARDGLGELTNVLAGNLKPLLPPGVGLSIPSVVLGKDYSLRVVGRGIRQSLSLEDEYGPFRITLVEVTD
ncbi:MAG: chemotaxis protein CheX [Acidobacteria bacterium]|nr:chemotaxis protein CheX [Acidobacteriota bacterium]